MAEGISASNGVISTSGVGGSYIRILRSDSAVPGGRRFITLLFGDEPPGTGAPSHAHSREEEAFYALSGELVIELEGEPVPHRVAPGWFFFGVRGQRHAFRNAGNLPARVLILCAPSGNLRNRWFADSSLEESGFELTVPSDRSVSNQGRQPLCDARRFGAGTGTEASKGK